jgi:hypothetical protein
MNVPSNRALQSTGTRLQAGAARRAGSRRRLSASVRRLGLAGVVLLMPVLAPAFPKAIGDKEWKLLETPVTVSARLRKFIPAEPDSMAACDFTLTVTDSTHSETLGTSLTAVKDLEDGLRVLKTAVAWRCPYLFVRTECGGGTAWGCNKEVVFEVSARRARRVGSFIVGDKPREAGQSLRDGRFLDWYDKLEDAQIGLCHACSPQFPIVFTLARGHLLVERDATWQANRPAYEKRLEEIASWLAGSSPADEETMAAIVGNLVFAKYCGRNREVADLLGKVMPHLSDEQKAGLRRALDLTVTLELPDAWRSKD